MYMFIYFLFILEVSHKISWVGGMLYWWHSNKIWLIVSTLYYNWQHIITVSYHFCLQMILYNIVMRCYSVRNSSPGFNDG